MRISQSIRNNLSRVTASVALALFVSLAAPVTAHALPAVSAVPAPVNVGYSQVKPGNLPRSSADTNTIQNILRIVFGIIGAFALMSMVASGFKYVTSAGDPGKTSEAKKGIIFALVGLMLAITAQAIVAFVIRRAAP
ncbi:MAG TPA: pilin [Candidatus Saccharimonadales bacterium]|nr:pilin [Candidatus Saccharimonadales bacterium]